MDKTALLRNVIDGIINENTEASTASFKEYATGKMKEVLEATAKKKALPEEDEEDADKVGKEVIKLANDSGDN